MFKSKIAYRIHLRRASIVRFGVILCALLVGSGDLLAQDKHWYFFNQQVSKQAAKKALRNNRLDPVFWSEWFHAWSAVGKSNAQMAGLDSCRLVAPLKVLNSGFEPPTLGFALEQIGADALINAGLTGKGVKIGIIDGGFLKADESPSLTPLIASGRLKGFRNFLQAKDTAAFNGSHALDDEHGTEVWELAGGLNGQKQIRFGLATGADYYLARTDHGAWEQRQEEDYLIAALEWLDSLGVKLVNISLGYSNGFDDPKDNYTREMMDGKTALASLACQKATNEKGMLIVVAAGNDGNNDWEVIDVPADAPGVLTVGATDLKFWRKMPFSSIGTGFTSFLKPDISCFASSGTSFSAPVITGLAACLWEAAPDLTNTSLKELILSSGHLAGAPNNYLGYGVPDAGWLMQKLSTTDDLLLPESGAIVIEAKKKKQLVLEGEEKKQIVLYHKKDNQHVVKEEFFSHQASFLIVRPFEQSAFTTVIVNHRVVMEIKWK